MTLRAFPRPARFQLSAVLTLPTARRVLATTASLSVAHSERQCSDVGTHSFTIPVVAGPPLRKEFQRLDLAVRLGDLADVTSPFTGIDDCYYPNALSLYVFLSWISSEHLN